jgi:hypothetical protein
MYKYTSELRADELGISPPANVCKADASACPFLTMHIGQAPIQTVAGFWPDHNINRAQLTAWTGALFQNSLLISIVAFCFGISENTTVFSNAINSHLVKTIAREKDSGFGWKSWGFWILRRIDICFFLSEKIEKTNKTNFMPMHMSFLKPNSTILYFL